mmetsp:Transcript_39250/g.118054  ORF Transcript_39250/g.118054 Transcript_39250/m.118054 type:complete len:256 (+) Transcript_39250:1632-2399(+)
MGVPPLGGRDGRALSRTGVGHLDVRGVADAIHVLVKAVQKVSEEFVGVVLGRAGEAGGEGGDGPFQGRGADGGRARGARVGHPQFLHCRVVRHGQFTAGPQGVGPVQIGLESIGQKVSSQRGGVSQALHRRIHEARISEVVQTHPSPVRIVPGHESLPHLLDAAGPPQAHCSLIRVVASLSSLLLRRLPQRAAILLVVRPVTYLTLAAAVVDALTRGALGPRPDGAARTAGMIEDRGARVGGMGVELVRRKRGVL